MEPRFHLRCLGLPQLSGPDGQPIRFKVRKHLALLVYLAVESRARHRRDHLAELLWPNLPEADGRHSLATGLSMLRSCFGRDVVDASRDDLRWAYTRLDLDLDRLAAGQVIGDEMTPMLDVADFLDGFEVPGATEFMLWRERQRARWLPQVRDALIVLMDRARRTGDSRQIEQLADRMLALDDLSEEAIRAKMEARAFAGDRLGALKIFESWRDRLGEELNAVPSSLLEGMALRLRKRGWERSAASPIASVRTDQWKGRTFVGRSAEYRALYEGWERTQAGLPGHALVIGESGIGKSTLVERLTTAAGLEGASVSRVQCYELEREIPYATLGGLVRGLLERPGASAVAPEALSELARTVPDVRTRFPHIPAAHDSEGESARVRLAEAMSQLVDAVSDEHPLILVVDDHHLADDASLAVLHLVMRRSEGKPLMMVLVGRSGAISASSPAGRLSASLVRMGIKSIEVMPLDPIESDELLATLIPADTTQPNTAVRRALTKAAHGFPMVLELLCHDWLTHGERCLALALHAMTAGPAQSDTLVEAYQKLHERILESLDTPTRNVLNVSALLGHRLNDISMYSLADLTVGQTMTGMSQLTALRILRDGGDGLEFVNELIRVHAYVSVPSAIRRVLHSNIADRLIENDTRGIEIEGLEVAWHCVRSGREDEAASYLLRGARQAIERGAPQLTERAIKTGLPLLQGEANKEGLLLLVEALQEEGQWNDSLETLESLPADLSPNQEAWAFVLKCVAQRFLGHHETPTSFETVVSLIECARRTKVERIATRALYCAAIITASTRDGPSIDSVLAALESTPISDDSELLLEVSLARAMLYAYAGRPVDCEAAISPALGLIISRERNGSVRATSVNGLGALLCGLGQYERALPHFETAYEMARRLDNDAIVCLATANAALCFGRLGKYQDQVCWGDKSLAAAGTSYTGHREIVACYSIAFGHAMLHRVDEALHQVADFEPRLPSTLPSWQIQGWLLGKADILMACGKRRQAIEIASAALESHNYELQAIGMAGPYSRWVALTMLERGEAKEGKTILRRLLSETRRLDRLDELELLCSIEFLTRAHSRGRQGKPLPMSIIQRLGSLPAPVASQLRVLGVL